MVSGKLPTRLASIKLSDDPTTATGTTVKVSRKTVQFDFQRNTVHDHYHLNDLSRGDFDNMWVSAENFMATKKEYIAVVRLMMRTIGNLPESDVMCTRGLEFKTKEGARKRKRVKQKACHAVLEEQDIQRDEGVFDPEFISDVYREMAGKSSLEALNRGLKDQHIMHTPLDVNDRFEREPKTMEVPVRRRSLTETLNPNDLLQTHCMVTA